MNNVNSVDRVTMWPCGIQKRNLNALIVAARVALQTMVY